MASFAHTNVVPFRSARRTASPRRDQKGLMEAIYSAGSLPLQAGDRESKMMAARLQVFGFVVIDEIQSDGTLRRLRPSESIEGRHRPPLAGIETLPVGLRRRHPRCRRLVVRAAAGLTVEIPSSAPQPSSC